MGTTVIHGGLPPHVRDRGGVFAEKPDAGPQSRLLAARTKVVALKQQHAAAQSTLRSAVEDDGGTYDFQALKGKVHRLASELAETEEEVTQWASVCKQLERADRHKRFDAALIEARAARTKFAELYRDACLQLGAWYALGSEIRELTNELADKMPTGHVYRPPDLTAALCEVDENPDPLSALKDAGYAETQTAASWRRHVAVVPLAPKEK